MSALEKAEKQKVGKQNVIGRAATEREMERWRDGEMEKEGEGGRQSDRVTVEHTDRWEAPAETTPSE